VATDPPVLAAYGETTWNAEGSPKSASAVSWLTGDQIVVLAATEDATATVGAANQLGLTFAPGTAVGTSGSSCWVQSWTATATSDQASVQVAFTCTWTSGKVWGAGVWVFRGSDGFGARVPATNTHDQTHTIDLARTYGNSKVVGIMVDWGAVATSGYAWTPALGANGHDRHHEQVTVTAVRYSLYVADWDDQGTAGTTSYGIDGITSANEWVKIALEVRGTAATGTESGPNYGGTATDLGGGDGSWVNPSYAAGASEPDEAVATWAVP
jgi:hypothetical protein